MALKEKINSGEFVVLGEFEPPKGSDLSPLLNSARPVRGRVDAIVVPEMANAVMKASSLGGGAFLKINGFEPVFQICCRDRNRLALQADILSAAGLGITDIMAVSGDEISHGDHYQARPVNDLDLIGLLECIQGLCRGKDMAGIELTGTPDLFVGSTFNAGATGGALDIEIDELNGKIGAGIKFIITTPVFDLHRFKQLMKRIDPERVAVIPTVMLLKSAGMARYIDRNIKHISIPAETIQIIQKSPDKIRECINIAGQLILQLKEMGAAGIMVSTMGWEDKLPGILDKAKI